jgi:sugar O-acyltransferase (sialic acid O-acetyltransferase NeuD family)
MRTEKVFLVGASGHGRVVLDALLQSGVLLSSVVVTDDNIELSPRKLLGLSVTSPAVQAKAAIASFHIAVGNGKIRKRLHEQLMVLGSFPLTVLHPSAVVSPFSTVEPGAFVGANSVVGPAATVGRGAIVNHGAVVDHDCEVGEFTHIAPNATLGGGVRIGQLVLIGAGATILPGVRVGNGAIVGAGAVVLHDVDAGATFVGLPAFDVYKK